MNSVGAELPLDARPFKCTPHFTEKTLPKALTREHSTKSGVWGVINVIRGNLRYVVPSADIDAILNPQTKGIISPQQSHHVEPIGKVLFFVEFWK